MSRVVVAGTLAYLGLHVLSLFVGREVLWGTNALSFLPRIIPLIAFAVALVLSGLALFGPLPGRFFAAPRSALEVWLWSAVAGALFWSVRSSTLLLGDGLPVVSALVRRDALPPLEPGAAAVERLFFDLLVRIAPAPTAFQTAWTAVALASCLCGVVFVGGSLLLVRELLATDPAEGDVRAQSLVIPLTAILVLQGYVEIFCGYAEHYAVPMAVMPWFALACLRAVSGRGSMVWPSLAFSVACVSHLGALVLAPALFALPLLRGPAAKGRQSIAADVASVLAPLLVIPIGRAALLRGEGPAELPGTLVRLASDLAMQFAGHGPAGGPGRPSLLDWFNGQMLAGPLSAPLAGALLVSRLRPGVRVGAIPALGMVMIASSAAAVLLAGDSNLGYARNWDLVAMITAPCAIGCLFLLIQASSRATLARCSVLLVTVSALHTLPWVAVNMDERASVERFASLPLGAGRAASSLGYWYALRGDTASARRWLEQAVADDSSDVRAQLALGRLDALGGLHGSAFDRFAAAARLRPDLVAASAGAALAALDMRAPDTARGFLLDLTRRAPAAAAPWIVLAEITPGAEGSAFRDSAATRGLEIPSPPFAKSDLDSTRRRLLELRDR